MVLFFCKYDTIAQDREPLIKQTNNIMGCVAEED